MIENATGKNPEEAAGVVRRTQQLNEVKTLPWSRQSVVASKYCPGTGVTLRVCCPDDAEDSRALMQRFQSGSASGVRRADEPKLYW